MRQYSIAFDVGGTFIKSAVLDENDTVCADSYAIYPANAHESKERLLDYLVDLIRRQLSKIMDKFFQVRGIGYAFPGPFDYENGICHIQGVQKFESLYGVNLKTEIYQRLMDNKGIKARLVTDIPIKFENDGDLFAMGAQIGGKTQGCERAMSVTIGTGAGSAFLQNGSIVKNGAGIPENGWIYHEPYKDSIIDDFISQRGIIKIAQELGMNSTTDVKELAIMAKSEDGNAKAVFRQFGLHLGEVLNRYIQSFDPQVIIIGGQISKSHELFYEGLMTTLVNRSVQIEFVEDTSRLTLLGVSALLNS